MQQTNTVNKIKFTLDNLNYDILAVDKDIQFVLPQSLPTKEELKDKLSPTVDITIKVYVKTLDKTPKITFIGENDNINVITYGSLSLLPHSIMSIALYTTDGGKNWMVVSCVQKLQINGLLLGSTIESGVNAARLTGTIEGDAPAEAAFVKASSNDNIPVSVGTPTKAQHATTKEYVDGKITGIFNYDFNTETLTIITN